MLEPQASSPSAHLLSAEEEANWPVNRIIFEDELVRIGLWRCRPWHRLFREDGQARGHYVVFPRSSVMITHSGAEPLVANPNVVVFYNKHQTYRRDKLSEQGDICEYFGYQGQGLASVMQGHDPAVVDRLHQPFTFTHGPSDAQSYLLQRLVVEHLLGHPEPDGLFVQEAALHLLERLLARALPVQRSSATGAATRQAHGQLARDTQALLTERYHEALTLSELAQALYTSPYHLSRVFRQWTGITVHHYRNQLRLRAALDYVRHTDLDLAEIGLALGYSSHSHFTQAFGRAFSATPSELRQGPHPHLRVEMSKNLTA